jgi:hypothetical protein
VRQGAGFSASYTLNRQAIVPRAVREATLWQAISGSSRVTPGTDSGRTCSSRRRRHRGV